MGENFYAGSPCSMQKAVAVLVIRDECYSCVSIENREMHFLEIPAGKLDSKEEVPLTAKRELEETNLVASEWVKMMEMVSALIRILRRRKITLFQAKCKLSRRCETCR